MKKLPGTDALAYFERSDSDEEKSFVTLTAAVNVTKNSTSLTRGQNKLECLFLASLFTFQPSLILVTKAGAYPKGASFRCRLLALPTNIGPVL
jgi:hypothetical protein